VVIAWSTGATKKKPMTKKEREKKKTQGETVEEVARASDMKPNTKPVVKGD
jgi:hypothetical protein